MNNDRKTYSDAMNDWKLKEAERSFLGKFRSSIFHPRYEASWPEKIAGYVLRLAVVAVVLAIGLYYWARLQSRQRGYRAHLAEGFANYYRGTNALMGPISWPLFNNNISFKTYSMDGQSGAFFHDMEAKAVNLELGTQFLSDTWVFDKMAIHELKVDLKSGGVGSSAAPVSSPSPTLGTDPASPQNRLILPSRTTGAATVKPPTQMLTAGFAFRPDLSKLKIGSYQIGELTCKWGNYETNNGQITESATLIHPSEKRPGAWTMTCSSGNFTQNWIKNTQIEKFQAEISNDLVEIQPGSSLSVGPAGRVFLNGPITMGEMPQLDLNVTLKDVDLRYLCPQVLHPLFMATVSGQGKITGTTNLESGIRMSIKCNLVEPAKAKMDDKPRNEDEGQKLLATLTDIPVLKALDLCTQERGFLKMRLLQGSFTIETGGQRMLIKDIDLVSREGRLRGELQCEERVVPVDKPAPGQSATEIGYFFTGEMLIGMNSSLAQKLPDSVKEAFLLPEKTADGLEWMKVSFQGDRGNAITASAGNKIVQLLRESWTKPSRK